MENKDTKEENLVVKRLLLVQAFTLNGVTEQSLYAHKGFAMIYRQDGVYCKYQNEKFVVPHSNVIFAHFV